MPFSGFQFSSQLCNGPGGMRAWLCRCAACHRYRRRPNSLHRLRRPSVLGLLRNVSRLVFSPTPIPSPLHLPRRLQATGRPGACVVGVLAARQLASAKRCPRLFPVYFVFSQLSSGMGSRLAHLAVNVRVSRSGLCCLCSAGVGERQEKALWAL